jgi:ABC-type transport system substrate-binding protein
VRLPTARLLPAVLAAVLCAACSNSPWKTGEPATNTLFDTFGDPATYDPSVCYNVTDGPIVDLIYPSYYRYRYPLRSSIDIELNLGSEPPKIEHGLFPFSDASGSHLQRGERWTFRIRPDARFQDDACFPEGKGRRVTARDIVYAFKRMADPKTICPVADFVSDKIVGWKAYAAGFAKKGRAHYDDPVPGIQEDLRDPYAFRVLLNQGYPQLRFLMAMHFTTPIPREAVELYGDAFSVRHPVGCGPFMVKELKLRDRMVLVRNPNCTWDTYPKDRRPGDDPDLTGPVAERIPFVDRIEFLSLGEPLAQYNLFQQGYLDSISAGYSTAQVIHGATGLDPEMRAAGVKLVDNPWPGYFYLAFNMEDSVFGGYTEAKRKLRQAISLAVDSDAYIQIICQGLGQKADFCIPPGLFGYEAGYRSPYRQYDPSLAKAKRLLSEAGYPNGIDSATGERLLLHLDNYSTTSSLRQMVRLIQIEIERLGINVDLRSTTYELFKEKLNKHQAQFCFTSWVADYPDPENFLTTMYGPNACPGPNESNYSNPRYDALFVKMRAMLDTPERLRLIRQMRDIAVEDCPLIPLSYGESRTMIQPWMLHAKPHPIANDTSTYWAVDPKLRTRLQSQWNAPRVWPLLALALLACIFLLPAASAFARHSRRKLRRNGP